MDELKKEIRNLSEITVMDNAYENMQDFRHRNEPQILVPTQICT